MEKTVELLMKNASLLDVELVAGVTQAGRHTSFYKGKGAGRDILRRRHYGSRSVRAGRMPGNSHGYSGRRASYTTRYPCVRQYDTKGRKALSVCQKNPGLIRGRSPLCLIRL